MARNDTRQIILSIAEELLTTMGYNGFSYQHIADRLNVKKAAIHYHFATKAELILEVIGIHRSRVAEAVNFAGDEAARVVLERTLSMYMNYDVKLGQASPESVLTAEIMAVPEEVQRATKSLCNEIILAISTCLEKGRENGEFNFSGNAEQQAEFVVATMIGAQQIASITDSDTVAFAANQLQKHFQVG